MANAANILPNYSMKGNIATGLKPSGDVLTSIGNIDDNVLSNTWRDNNKYYYYNTNASDNTVNSPNSLSKIFKKNVLTGNRDINGAGAFDDIDDAIENAACGNWAAQDGICSNPPYASSGGPTDEENNTGSYTNKNELNDPASNKSVCTSLNKFISSVGSDAEADKLPQPFDITSCNLSGQVSKQTFYSTVSYLISRIIAEKSRFYNTEPLKNDMAKYTGWKGMTTLLHENTPRVRMFLYICYAISFYFILVGLKAIYLSPTSNISKSISKKTSQQSTLSSSITEVASSVFNSTFITPMDALVFFIVMLLIFFLSGIIFSDNSRFYILSSPSKNFLTEPCDVEPDKSNFQGLGTICFLTILITLLLMCQNLFSSKIVNENGNFILYFLYFLFYILLVGIIYYFCFEQKSGYKTNEDTYLISYNIQDANNNYFLPYIYKNAGKINYTFFTLLFIVVVVCTIISVVLSTGIFGGQNSHSRNKIFGFIYPFLTLRSPIIMVCTLLVLTKVPFIYIIYPLIILLQRLIVGNLIAPVILKSVLGRDNTNKSSMTILFESLVGWDLLLWPLFKIADVTQTFLDGTDLSTFEAKNSASNLNVFSSFSSEIGLESILKILLLVSPVSFAHFFNKFGSWGAGLLAILASGIILFGMLLVSYIFIWYGNKFTYFKDNYNIDFSDTNKDNWKILGITFNPLISKNILLYIFLFLWLGLFFKTSKSTYKGLIFISLIVAIISFSLILVYLTK